MNSSHPARSGHRADRHPPESPLPRWREGESVPLALSARIRYARRDDLDLLEWWGLHAEQRDTIRAAFERQRTGELVILVADLGGFPVGQVWLDFRTVPGSRGQAGASLWAVRVLPPLRRQGLGAALIRSAEGLAKSRGYRGVSLTVERTNDGAIRFYEGLGYVTPADEKSEYILQIVNGSTRPVPVNQLVMVKDL